MKRTKKAVASLQKNIETASREATPRIAVHNEIISKMEHLKGRAQRLVREIDFQLGWTESGDPDDDPTEWHDLTPGQIDAATGIVDQLISAIEEA